MSVHKFDGNLSSSWDISARNKVVDQSIWPQLICSWNIMFEDNSFNLWTSDTVCPWSLLLAKWVRSTYHFPSLFFLFLRHSLLSFRQQTYITQCYDIKKGDCQLQWRSWSNINYDVPEATPTRQYQGCGLGAIINSPRATVLARPRSLFSPELNSERW